MKTPRAAPRIVVSAAGTGAGKTLVSLALCAALRDAGLRVRAYKVGPDYIDPRLYAEILGEPAHNLDLWLDGESGVRTHVERTLGDADVCIIEGMMGLFDGDDEGETSTAAIAQALDASVVTVLDGWTSSQSAAAVALGLRAFDPALRHLGVILNRAGGPAHARAVATACERHGIDVLATLPYDPAFAFPERTLGLDRAAFAARAHVVDAAAARLREALDVVDLFARVPAPLSPAISPPLVTPLRTRVGYASDEAFWFTYPETLEALALAGAQLVPFSPLHDRALPSSLGAVWIGGGYPEDHPAALEANRSMRASLREAIGDGMPAYAECGGLMYLAERLIVADGAYAMAGIVPGATSYVEPRLRIGYRRARVPQTTVLDLQGADVRGYEFHYAAAELEGTSPAYRYDDGDDGYATSTCVAAFLHRHFIPGDPAILRYVDAAAAFAPASRS